MEQEEFDELLESMHCSVFHMSDEEAKPIVKKYLENHPGLLEFHSEDWYFKNI